ncbi:MAG: hypothetical protein QOJ94_2045 [Sphingomonadales bacterium]|jgi:hypothetical protein|nr:hypothetical protein [Sphingomonadales bacterium]
MRRAARFAALAAGLAALSGCHKTPAGGQGGGEAQIVDIPQTIVSEAPGTTPMKDRVAVIGLLNKRNGLSRDLVMKPGQAFRVKDVIVRLRACETTAPWEAQKLTGAFVQVFIRDTHGDFRRRFSGWLYKETPSLNVVEHPVYDVWVKSCAMTHPEAGASTVRAGSAASSRSSAPNSAPSSRTATPAATPAPSAPAPPIAEANNAT